MLRADRADVVEQLVRLADARSSWAAAVRDLDRACSEKDLDAVREECRALERVLTTRAKRPPIPDATGLAGAISAAERIAARSDEWDDAVRAAREAEADHDRALNDLATARGEDAA